jgi:hypothetical protein
MKETTGFFEASPGDKSIMRLVFAFLMGYAALASAYMFITADEYAAGIAVFSSIAGVATGLKLIQKESERKEKNGKPPMNGRISLSPSMIYVFGAALVSIGIFLGVNVYGTKDDVADVKADLDEHVVKFDEYKKQKTKDDKEFSKVLHKFAVELAIINASKPDSRRSR